MDYARVGARAQSAEERDGDDERVFTRAVLGSKGGEMCQLRHVSFPALRDGVRWGVRGHDDGVRRAGRLVKLDPELVLPQTAYLGGPSPKTSTRTKPSASGSRLETKRWSTLDTGTARGRRGISAPPPRRPSRIRWLRSAFVWVSSSPKARGGPGGVGCAMPKWSPLAN